MKYQQNPPQPRITGKGRHFAVRAIVRDPLGGFTVRWFAYGTEAGAKAQAAIYSGLYRCNTEILKVTSKQADEIFRCKWDYDQSGEPDLPPPEKPTRLSDIAEALAACITTASDPARYLLAVTLRNWAEAFPSSYRDATDNDAPPALRALLKVIEEASRPYYPDAD